MAPKLKAVTARRGDDQFLLRFPEGMRERIKDEADHAGRSMNTEIIMRLEASFGARVQIAPAIAEFIEQHIQSEVKARLQQIAAQIGGGA